MNFNEEQLKAIEAREHTVLVSAAAGSGKTAVLIERIRRLISEGASLSRMLVITFTHAAASEMRQRLEKGLLEVYASDPALYGKALDELECAQVSTIHSFCQHVLKEHFEKAGIDAMVRVCSEQERDELFAKAWHDAACALLDRGDTELLPLASAMKNETLYDTTSRVYRFMMSLPEPFAWLDGAVDALRVRPFSETVWYQQFADSARLMAEGLHEQVKSLRARGQHPDAVEVQAATVETDAEVARLITEAAKAGLRELYEACATTGKPKNPTVRNASEPEKRWLEIYRGDRKLFYATIADICGLLTPDNARAELELDNQLQLVLGLRALLRETHTRFRELKRDRNVIDFSDMEQMTGELMKIPACLESLRAEYDHIFVDECQDVSGIQDAIVHALQSETSTLFMVGDPKQSIYRFRQADPTLFMGYIDRFSKEAGAPERAIFLQNNYRSRSTVLDAANEVFRRAMRRDVTEMDYRLEDELRAGVPSQNDPPIEILFSNCTEGSGDAPLRAEAEVVVRRIKELLQTDKDPAKPGEKYRLRDMVILLSKVRGTGSKLTEYLRQAGIPCYFDGKENYYDLPEVRRVKSMLELVDNGLQDVPLIATLRCPPFSFTANDLSRVRLTRNTGKTPFHECFRLMCEEDSALGERCRAARDRIENWRFRADVMHLTDFVWHVMRDTGYYAECGAMPGGDQRQANLRLLAARAEEYEKSSNDGLHGFLNEIRLQSESGDSTSAHVLGPNEDLVHIMTMHKSKGLEFPVVFLMRMTESLLRQDRSPVKLHRRLGISLGYLDGRLHAKTNDTLLNAAFKARMEMEERSERCRLLYVAMTRAKDRMILTGCSRDGEHSPSWFMEPCNYRVASASCMVDWVMQAVCDEVKLDMPLAEPLLNEPWLVSCEPEPQAAGNAQTGTDGRQPMEVIREILSQAPDADACYRWTHPEARDTTPLKTSVTSLVHREQTGQRILEQTEETLMSKSQPAPELPPDAQRTLKPFQLSDIPEKPAFMTEKKVTGAERGTVMHRFLLLAPLEKLRGCPTADYTRVLREEADALIAKGCFNADEAPLVDADRVAAFFLSPLGQRMLHADRVQREWGFNLLIDGRTVLQGIIDAAFMEDGQWVILDYKTDHITDPAAFVEKHSPQLSWYKKALETLDGRPVKELWLYSLGLAKAFEVNEG